jgi:hypothetical protein
MPPIGAGVRLGLSERDFFAAQHRQQVFLAQLALA